MAKFTVEHKTKLSKDEAFKKVQDYLQNSEGLKKLDSNLEYSFDQANYSGHVKSSKFQCDLKITGSQPAMVTLDISLNFLLTPFKSKIQDTLQSKITQILG